MYAHRKMSCPVNSLQMISRIEQNQILQHYVQKRLIVYVENKLKIVLLSYKNDFIQDFLINAVKINAQIKQNCKKLCILLKFNFSNMHKEFNIRLVVIT